MRIEKNSRAEDEAQHVEEDAIPENDLQDQAPSEGEDNAEIDGDGIDEDEEDGIHYILA